MSLNTWNIAQVIILGGPNHDRIGFRYWKHPGPFNQLHGIGGSKGRFLAFWAVLTQAAFSFIGTEIVAVCLDLYYLIVTLMHFIVPDCCW